MVKCGSVRPAPFFAFGLGVADERTDYVESVTSPSINLVAGFLSTGSETATSIAITAVYTSEIYRGKGVAESLIRAACRANLEKPKPGKSSIVALIPDPGVVRRASSHSAAATKEGDQKPPAGVRLFARLGFRILDNVRPAPCLCWVLCAERRIGGVLARWLAGWCRGE